MIYDVYQYDWNLVESKIRLKGKTRDVWLIESLQWGRTDKHIEDRFCVPLTIMYVPFISLLDEL